MKKINFLALLLGCCIIGVFSIYNTSSSASIISGGNSSEFNTYDGNAGSNSSYSSKKMSLNTIYLTTNLAKIKSTDTIFGSTAFYNTEFFDSDYNCLESVYDSSDIYSTYTNYYSEAQYMVSMFSCSDYVDMPISVGDICEVADGRTQTLSFTTQTSGTYTYQETSTTTVSSGVSASISASYLGIKCKLSESITSTVSNTVSSSQSYTITSEETDSETITNSTGSSQYYSYQDRGIYTPYVVAVYKYNSLLTCKLVQIYYQYVYKTDYYKIELLDIDTDEGCFYLDSSCMKDNLYYFDEAF